MLQSKQVAHGVSHGLSEIGYDIRIKQSIQFVPSPIHDFQSFVFGEEDVEVTNGRFVLASAIEEFDMPNNLMGVVHDKSSWARAGVSVFNTVIEPGWKGFLTLELVYHGQDTLIIPAGAGIAQVVFHEISVDAEYKGKYQNQADKPVPAIAEQTGQ
jgi:dCTP deaminase